MKLIFKKIFAGIFTAAFLLSLIVSKPLHLSEAGKNFNPVVAPISSAIYGKVSVISAPLGGIKVVLFTKIKGKQLVIKETTTNGSGNYFFEELSNEKYFVSPKDENYIFSPKQRVINFSKCLDNNCIVSGMDFLGTSR